MTPGEEAGAPVLGGPPTIKPTLIDLSKAPSVAVEGAGDGPPIQTQLDSVPFGDGYGQGTAPDEDAPPTVTSGRDTPLGNATLVPQAADISPGEPPTRTTADTTTPTGSVMPTMEAAEGGGGQAAGEFTTSTGVSDSEPARLSQDPDQNGVQFAQSSKTETDISVIPSPQGGIIYESLPELSNLETGITTKVVTFNRKGRRYFAAAVGLPDEIAETDEAWAITDGISITNEGARSSIFHPNLHFDMNPALYDGVMPDELAQRLASLDARIAPPSEGQTDRRVTVTNKLGAARRLIRTGDDVIYVPDPVYLDGVLPIVANQYPGSVVISDDGFRPTRLSKSTETILHQLDNARRSGLRPKNQQKTYKDNLEPLREEAIRGLRNTFENRVIFEDDDILVFDKPPHILSHRSHPSNSGLVEVARELRGDRVNLAHRLDCDTSGVIVLTKNPNANASLLEQFARVSPGLSKTYFAVVAGIVPFSLGRNADVPGQLHYNRLGNRVDDVVLWPDQDIEPVKGKKIKNSSTGIRPLIELQGADGIFTLAEIDLHTGRTHQIRAVTAFLGTPVVWDAVYNDIDQLASDAQRQLLHARRLTLVHPRTSIPTTFEAPIPPDMEKFMRDKAPIRIHPRARMYADLAALYDL